MSFLMSILPAQAAARITRLEAENAALRARITELETPDMFWDDDAPENTLSGETLEEAIQDLNMFPGFSSVVIMSVARKCPDLYIVLHSDGQRATYTQFPTYEEALVTCCRANEAAAAHKENDHA